jgi:hypothetical protein
VPGPTIGQDLDMGIAIPDMQDEHDTSDDRIVAQAARTARRQGS